jgi:hypothetical protein
MATVFGIVYATQSLANVPALLVTQASPVVADVLTVLFSLILAPVAALVPLGAVALFAELRAGCTRRPRPTWPRPGSRGASLHSRQ